MRYFSRLLLELRDTIAKSKLGEPLTPPPLLNSTTIDGRRLTFVQMGLANTARPVILLHGFGGFFMDWPRIMKPLSKHFHLFALDMPGWGFSEPNLQARGMESDVKVVQEFMVKMGLKDVILVGLSYGGGVAWASGALHMPNLKHLLLVNPMPPFPLEHMRSPIYRAIFHINRSELLARIGNRFLTKAQFKIISKVCLKHERLLDSFYLDLAYHVVKQPHMGQVLFGNARGAKEVDWQSWQNRLGLIRTPTTILQGLDDKVFSLNSARYLRDLIPNARLIEVPDCGHAMVFDQHRKIIETIYELSPILEAQLAGHGS